MTSRTAITPAVLDLPALVRLVDGPGHGAVVAFLGLVRNHNVGRQVTHLVYEAYDALALKALDRIVQEAGERWPSVLMAVHHRTGRLEIGETSVVIAASAPHRQAAFQACEWAIKELKRTVPIWKKEVFESGDEEWVGAADQR